MTDAEINEVVEELALNLCVTRAKLYIDKEGKVALIRISPRAEVSGEFSKAFPMAYDLSWFECRWDGFQVFYGAK